jgi:hypothetical protein
MFVFLRFQTLNRYKVYLFNENCKPGYAIYRNTKPCLCLLFNTSLVVLLVVLFKLNNHSTVIISSQYVRLFFTNFYLIYMTYLAFYF